MFWFSFSAFAVLVGCHLWCDRSGEPVAASEGAAALGSEVQAELRGHGETVPWPVTHL